MRWCTAVAVLTAAATSAEATQPPGAAQCCTVTIRVRVPDATDTVYLAGSLSAIGQWRPDGVALTGEGRDRTVQLTVPPGTSFEYKFTLGSWAREALDAAGAVPRDHEITVRRDTVVVHEVTAWKQGSNDDPEREQRAYIADWQGSGVLGRLVYWTDVPSAFLAATRHVEVWLPPGYDADTARRYPVLYMSDGQNLFDPRIANTGVDWGVDEAVVRLVERGVMPPIIVVGVWSTPQRTREYLPQLGAPTYARFLIEELMPRVNAEFRTLTGPANTTTMGSSAGGLLSFYLVTHHADVFGACGCVSTHFPVSEALVARIVPDAVATPTPDSVPYVLRDIERGLVAPQGVRYWFDYGGRGLDAEYGPTHDAVREWLLRQRFVEGRDFVVRRYPEATHNETWWRARLPDHLTFLYGPRQR